MLPPELIILIFELAADSFHPLDLSSTLRSSCLVSKTWHSLAQPILFATLPRYKKGCNGETLIRTLTKETHLQSHIHRLWVSPEMFKSQHVLFKLLSQVRGLGLRQSGFSELVHYPHVLRSTLASASLTSLSLQAIEDFPVQLFYHCVSLQELHISNTTFELTLPGIPTAQDDGDEVVVRPHLRYLHVDMYIEEETPFLTWIQQPDSAFDLSQLHTFHLSSHSSRYKAQHQAISDFIVRVAGSVEDLMINVPRPIVMGILQHDLSYKTISPLLIHLRILRFRFTDVPSKLSTLSTLSTISWIMDFLSNLPYPQLLHEVWIPALLPYRTTVIPGMNSKNSTSVAVRRLYGSLDRLLNTEEAFGALKRVWMVYFEPNASTTVGLESAAGVRMKELLPSMKEKGVVKMRYPKYGRHVVTETEDSLYGRLIRPLDER